MAEIDREGSISAENVNRPREEILLGDVQVRVRTFDRVDEHPVGFDLVFDFGVHI